MHTQAMFTHEEDVKPKRQKLTDEEKKEKQRAYAKSWYQRNNSGKAKTKKQKTPSRKKKSPLKAEHSSFTFLFFLHDKEEYTELVEVTKADQRAQEIFADPDYKDLQQIYFMKPLRLYNRPVMEITEL